jgi:hypothetical protein
MNPPPLDPGSDPGPPRERFNWKVPSPVRRALFYFVASMGAILLAIGALVVLKVFRVEAPEATTIMAMILGFAAVLLAQTRAAFELANAVTDAEEKQRAAERRARRAELELEQSLDPDQAAEEDPG